MALFAAAIPILPGKTDAWRQFVDELAGARKAEFDASRRRHGVRERTFLQQTPMGDFAVVTLEGDDPAGAFLRFAQDSDEFATWFKDRLREVHGVDPDAPPPGPLPELVVDSGAD